ncbi:MAG: InlB B-repeat-containing protein, partial [Clostridia bacterium]|nr:InlB B-repeat-containing protein [Clostridia bacterium]
TFDGWKVWDDDADDGAGAFVDFALTSNVLENTTLVAKWTPKTYTVTFDLDGKTLSGGCDFPASIPVTYPSNAAAALATAGKAAAPVADHYNFTGWKLGTEDFLIGDGVLGNITLVAQWTPKVYTVTFNLDGKTLSAGCNFPASVDVTYPGTAAAALTAGTFAAGPLSDNYTFTGWKLADADYLLTADVTASITIVAQWTPKTFTVEFDPGDDDWWIEDAADNLATQLLEYDEIPVMPDTTDVARAGYELVGWFTMMGTEKVYFDLDDDDFLALLPFEFDTTTTFTAEWLELFTLRTTITKTGLPTSLTLEGANVTQQFAATVERKDLTSSTEKWEAFATAPTGTTLTTAWSVEPATGASISAAGLFTATATGTYTVKVTATLTFADTTRAPIVETDTFVVTVVPHVTPSPSSTATATPTPSGTTTDDPSPSPSDTITVGKLGDANCDTFVNIDDILFVRDEIFGAGKITPQGRANLLMTADDTCKIDHILAIRDVIFGAEYKLN